MGEDDGVSGRSVRKVRRVVRRDPPEPPAEDWVVLRTFEQPGRAEVSAHELEAAGIPHIVRRTNHLSGGLQRDYELVVLGRDADFAEALIVDGIDRQVAIVESVVEAGRARDRGARRRRAPRVRRALFWLLVVGLAAFLAWAIAGQFGLT